MRFAKRKRRAVQSGRGAGVLLSLLFVGIALWALAPILQNLMEQAVLFSSVAVVPDAGLTALREHFSSELYHPTPKPSTDQQEQTDATPTPPTANLPNPVPIPSQPQDPNAPPPDIPEEFVGSLLSQTILSSESEGHLAVGEGYLHNYTSLTQEDILRTIEQTELFEISQEGPQVLIFHTHATESFEEYDREVFDIRSDWRTLNSEQNMCAVGEVMADTLKEHGIEVIHDTTLHDYPSYNGSYDNSAQTVSEILADNPSIKVVIDLHRDAILPDETTTIKPVTTIDGVKVAQIMIATGCESEIIDLPNWNENLRFAVELQNQIERDYPTLARPIFFNYRQYNLELSPGSLLIEIGSVGNTLHEAKAAAMLTANSLARVIESMQE